ncbi:MAG: NrdH-redoxin [bacterium (Candidatus Stahlbacteria) CG23_combo_of_CG06-09_8_20_14_all_34_7]|nr:MAG: NrdH-redoxin [bacterium (Candidatus Stahlbacteria) CG23_combo_of_CG06-09_8_20_14_all_34_7]
MAVVKVYSTSSCPWCARAKQYLRSKNIPFADINVATDRNAAMEMVRKSGQQGVPVIDIDGNIIVGFDQARIDSLLGIA